MGAADDVFDMRELCSEIASREAPGSSVKERVTVVSRGVGVGWNRALEFLSGRARRVDAWEKEHAKRRVAELRDAERRERESAHLLWLESELGRLRASGEEFHGPHVDGLEHFLRVARGADRPVALPDERDVD